MRSGLTLAQTDVFDPLRKPRPLIRACHRDLRVIYLVIPIARAAP